MLDELNLEELSSAAAFVAGGSRRAYPVLLDENPYHTDGLDPNAHYFTGRRLDPLGDPVAPIKVYLHPNDPYANSTDPNKRRPSILSFQFPEFAKAWADARSADEDVRNRALDVLAELSKDIRATTYTEPGGVIIAEGVEESEEGIIVARWLKFGRKNAADTNHLIPAIDWTTVRRRKESKSVQVEALRPGEAIITSDIDALKAALLTTFHSDANHGTPAAYLRLLKMDAAGNTTVMIPGGTATGGGIIDLRDKKQGDKYVPRSPEEGIDDFMNSALAKKLAVPWGSARIEVIPLSVIHFGEKSLEKIKTPDAAFHIPPADGKPDEVIQGYAISTIRLSAGTTGNHYLASLVAPVTGELLRLEDLPTPNYDPKVEPSFAVFTRKAADPNAPLTDNFAL